MPEVVLRSGPGTLAVEGGDLLSLRSWSVDGTELLAAPSALPVRYRVHGQRAGVPFLHPWANRVREDAFTLAGREVRIGSDAAVSRDGDGIAIHGLAAPGAWVPRAEAEDRCVVERAVPAVPAFPFAHAVRVEVRLAPARVEVLTVLEATDGPLPVAHGWHPYFVPGPEPRDEWELGLPERHAAGGAEPAERAPLAGRAFDDGYVDVAGTTWTAGPIGVELGPGYAVAQVFAPLDCDVVSLEPMTAPTDALRTGAGLLVLEPGTRHTAAFALTYRSTSSL